MAEITKSLEETAGKITGGLGQSLSKLSSAANEQSDLLDNMSNSEYLGAIYKLLVQSADNNKLQQQKEQNSKEESELEEENRHALIIQALTLRRMPQKPATQLRDEKGRFKKAEPEEVKIVKPTEKTKVEVKKPEVKAPEAKKVEVLKAEPVSKVKEVATPPKTSEIVKPVKPELKPSTPIRPQKLPVTSTAVKVVAGATATVAALSGKESLAANIAKYESRGSSGRSFGGDEYNAYNKGTVGNKMIPADKPINFSEMKISEFLRRGELDARDPDRLFAVGRYQIIPKTMENLVKSLKLDPNTTTLTPEVQDMLFAKGLTTSVQGRSAVENYIKGKPGATRDDAILALSMEFASVGVPYDIPKMSMFKNTLPKSNLKKGESFYSGIGGNKAHNSPEEVGMALDTDRMKNIKSTQLPAPVRGVDISEKAISNVDMKKEMSNQRPAPQNVTNVTNVSGTTADTSTVKRVDDRPAHERTR